jgi:hypothetical protein
MFFRIERSGPRGGPPGIAESGIAGSGRRPVNPYPGSAIQAMITPFLRGHVTVAFCIAGPI